MDKSVLDVVDLDAAANVVARGRGVPQSILRTDEEVDELRTARQKPWKKRSKSYATTNGPANGRCNC